MKRTITAGRRFTRAVVEVENDAQGERVVEVLSPVAHFSASTLRTHHAKALQVLAAAGLPTDPGVTAPPGSLWGPLSDAAMNAGHEADSPVGLAATVADLCTALLPQLRAADAVTAGTLAQAYHLGRALTLAPVYGADSEAQSMRAKAPRKRDPLRTELVEDLAVHRRAGRTLDQALEAMADTAHGVRVRRQGDAYRIESSTQRGALVRARGTLETAWAEAAKVQPRRRRPATSGR